MRDEFIELGRKTDRTAEEDFRLDGLKQEMATHILALAASDVYLRTA